MEKEQFLEMFKQCLRDGDIRIELETNRDEYYGDEIVLTVKVGDNYTLVSVG